MYKILYDFKNYLPGELKELFWYHNAIQYSLRDRRKLIDQSHNFKVTYESPVARLRKYWNVFSRINATQITILQFKSAAKIYCFTR